MVSTQQRAASAQKRMSAEQRRAHIEMSARDVFIAQGLKGARTRDIAAAAGINEALLYRHFASKEELFVAAIVTPLRELIARRAEADSIPPTHAQNSQDEMVERTRLFIASLIDVLRDVAPLLGVLMFDGEESASKHYQEILVPVLKEIGDRIRTNLGWWDHRNFDVDAAVRFAFGAVWFEVLSGRLENRAIDAATASREFAEMVVLGLATRP